MKLKQVALVVGTTVVTLGAMSGIAQAATLVTFSTNPSGPNSSAVL